MVKYTEEELDQKLKEIKRRDKIKVDEPGLFEKIYGIFAEPADLFNKLSYFKPNALNWLLPIVSYVLIFSFCEYLMQNNPSVLKTKFENQYGVMENKVDASIEKGTLSREEAEEILDKEYDKAKYFSVGPNFVPTLIFKTVTTLFSFFITIILLQFFMNLFYQELYKIKMTMVVYGLPFLIPSLEVLVRTILVYVTGTYYPVLDFSSVLLFQNNFLAYIFSKLNPFEIWFNVVVCIGFVQMYRLKTKRKIYMLVFGSWFVLLSIGYFITQYIQAFSR